MEELAKQGALDAIDDSIRCGMNRNGAKE